MLTETRMALESAADLLMDHGIIRTGAELEQVCQQIRDLAKKKMYVEFTISDFQILASNAPRDHLIGALRSAGIPAAPSAKGNNMDFSSSIRVERGALHYMFDAVTYQHRFRWEPAGAPL